MKAGAIAGYGAATLLVFGLAAGCGGRGDIASSELYEVGGGSSSDGQGGSGGSSGSGGRSGDTSTLGPCKRGFMPGAAGRGTCDWLGSDGLCYGSREGACACVCPRDRDSVCQSGFFNGPDGRTPVNCD